MKKLLVSALATTSLFYAAGKAQAVFIPNPVLPSEAQEVLLDNFETGDQEIDLVGPLPKAGTDTVSGAGIIGGERELSLTLTKAATARRGATLSADSPGETSLILSNRDQSRSVATSSYTNLGGLDFSLGTAFLFDLISSDLGIELSVTVDGVTATDDLPAVSSATTYAVPFNLFPGVDFSSVDNISFTLTSTVDSADASLDNFGYVSVIPEPMTMTGLALGALGLVKFKSAKKQKQA